jgi:hypothetical protein
MGARLLSGSRTLRKEPAITGDSTTPLRPEPRVLKTARGTSPATGVARMRVDRRIVSEKSLARVRAGTATEKSPPPGLGELPAAGRGIR